MQDGEGLNGNLAFLISQLGFHIAGQFGDRLGSMGMAPKHFGMMSLIERSEGQTQQQLADRLGIHRNAMVALTDELEARGWVQRRVFPGDRRAYALHLTAEGQKTLERGREMAKEIETDLLDSLSAVQRDRLQSVMSTLVDDAGLTPGIHPAMRWLGWIG